MPDNALLVLNELIVAYRRKAVHAHASGAAHGPTFQSCRAAQCAAAGELLARAEAVAHVPEEQG